jgi:hypothetical protein
VLIARAGDARTADLPDPDNEGVRPPTFRSGEAMDPTQIRIFLAMGLMSLLFAAQVAMQSGGLVALP